MDNLNICNVEKGPNSVNCPNFVTIFCRVVKMKKIFIDIPINPRPLPFEIHWPINFTKKNYVSVYFQQQKIVQVYIGISILVIPDHICIVQKDKPMFVGE